MILISLKLSRLICGKIAVLFIAIETNNNDCTQFSWKRSFTHNNRVIENDKQCKFEKNKNCRLYHWEETKNAMERCEYYNNLFLAFERKDGKNETIT